MKSTFKTSLIEKYQHPYVKLTIGSTEVPTDDILAGSFSYKGGASSGGSLEPGGCVIGSVTFAVYNYDGKYTSVISDGAEVKAYIGYGTSPTTATYGLIATTYISEWNIKRGSITVTAYDALRKADKAMWTSWSFPMTVSDIIVSAANEAGVSINTTPSAGGSISVDLRTANEDGTYTDPDISMTCRQAISEALKLSGNFGYCNEDGALCCDWFSWGTTAATIEDTFSASFTSAKSYTGVQVGTRDVVGSNSYMFALASNSFLTDDNAADVESRLYDALVGYDFDCGSAGILQNPNIEPGDIVELVTPMGTKKIPVTAITLKGSMIENISCEATSYDEAEDERQDASNDALADKIDGGDFDFDTSEIEQQISTIGNKITTVNDDIDALKLTHDKDVKTLQNSLKTLSDALGGYSIVVITATDYSKLKTPDENTLYFTY